MHEVGLVEGIIDAVRRRAGERPVARVTVRIGVLHRAAPGPMEQAFEMVGAGTNVEGARLDLVQTPVASTCRDCGRSEQGTEMDPVCQGCGSSSMVYSGGDELMLESIEYREPAHPAVPATGV